MNRDLTHTKALSGKSHSSFSHAAELSRICNIFLSGIKAEQAFDQALGIIRNISGLENIFGLLYLSDRNLLEPIEDSVGKGFPPLNSTGTFWDFLQATTRVWTSDRSI